MRKKKNGFAATGILYTILIIFLVLMTTLLATLSSRSRILGKLKNDAKDIGKKEIEGIENKTYEVADEVTYLGYTWLVMADYGNSVKILLSDHLTQSELQASLPSDVSSDVIDSDGIPMCVSGTSYCPSRYNYKTSLIKKTVENWLDKKMQENNLEINSELELMNFTDGNDTIESYVRIPIHEEEGLYKTVLEQTYSASYLTEGYYTVINGCRYDPLLSNKGQDGDIIATLTDIGGDHTQAYYVLPFTGNAWCSAGEIRGSYNTSQIMPIITVKKN